MGSEDCDKSRQKKENKENEKRRPASLNQYENEKKCIEDHKQNRDESDQVLTLPKISPNPSDHIQQRMIMPVLPSVRRKLTPTMAKITVNGVIQT